MAIVVDASRDDVAVECANVTYQKGNDSTGAAPAWASEFLLEAATAVETHIGRPTESGVDNTLDSWTPYADFSLFWLPSVPNTDRP